MELNINGKVRKLDVPEDTPLLWVIRDELNLTGTKYGCGMSVCGDHVEFRFVSSSANG